MIKFPSILYLLSRELLERMAVNTTLCELSLPDSQISLSGTFGFPGQLGIRLVIYPLPILTNLLRPCDANIDPLS